MSDATPSPTPVLRLSGITKVYPGVVALEAVDLAIYPNEVVGLIGENGAGKSTLMKVLVGYVQPDSGRLETAKDGPVVLAGPASAIEHGIGMVFQEGALIPNLSVLDNLFLCHEKTFERFGFLARREMKRIAREQIRLAQIDVDVDSLVQDLTLAHRQMVEVARLLWLSSIYGHPNPVLILDEPTAILSDTEVDTLFSILRSIKHRASVVLISHRLSEVVENSDRIVILKDGRNVAEMPAGSAKITDIEQLMVGHEVSADRYLEEYQHEPQAAEVLRVDELRVEGQFEPLDFSLRKGEIVGLIGLIGSGKEAVRDCLTGIRRADGGDIYLEGVKISPGNPHQSIRLGIGHVPIERRSQGLATGMSVQDNINLLVLKSLRRGGLLTRKVGRRNAQRWVERCRIKTPSLDVLSGTLSGGNQQKVVIAKWIGAGTRFLILDHPTRGVDVGAKEEIYHLIRDLAQEGIAILIMCDTLEEDIGLSNRILLMKEGRLIKEMAAPPNAKPTPSDIIKFIV